jgi:hypothetical protein
MDLNKTLLTKHRIFNNNRKKYLQAVTNIMMK